MTNTFILPVACWSKHRERLPKRQLVFHKQATYPKSQKHTCGMEHLMGYPMGILLLNTLASAQKRAEQSQPAHASGFLFAWEGGRSSHPHASELE